MSDIRNFEEYRRQVLDSLGEDYTVEDLRNFERWRLKVLHGLDGSGKIYSTLAVTDSASGSIASITDGADDVPVKSLKVNIAPKQSGSGDPSPSNVRPITGWDEVEVYVTGTNIWDEEWEVGSYDTITGEKTVFSSTIRSKNKIPVSPNTEYYFNTDGVVLFYKQNEEYQTFSPVNNRTFTTPTECGYVAFRTGGGYGTTYNHDISINYPSTDTSYHPYQGESKYIPFKDSNGDPITVYGGEIDVVSGLLKSYPFYSSYNGETLSGEWICDRAVYSQGTTPPIGSQVVDMSGNGTEYQLDPTEIRTLKGVNNVWADTGDVDVEYIADTKTYIDNKVAELQALVLENIGG